MDTGLSGKRVLVTGASGGIGAACARAFAAEGSRVVVHYNNGLERAEAVAADCGGNAVLIQADLTRESEAERLYSEARAALGGLDACVAVAGIWPEEDVPLWKLPLDRWQETARGQPHRHLPDGAGIPAGGGALRSRQPRPRRLDRGALRRGRARGLRLGQVGHRSRASAQPQERDRADRAARTGQRRLPGLDGLADDPLDHGRAGPRGSHHAHHAPSKGRRARGRRRARSSSSPPTSSQATSRARWSSSRAAWRAGSSTTAPEARGGRGGPEAAPGRGGRGEAS